MWIPLSHIGGRSILCMSSKLCFSCSRYFQSILSKQNLHTLYLPHNQLERYDQFYLRKQFICITSKRLKEIKDIDNSVTEARKLSKSDIKRLISFLKPQTWSLMGAIGLLLVSSTVTMAIPFAMGKVIDTIYTTDTTEMETLNKLCITLTLVFIVGAACNFGRVYLMNVSGQKITKALRERVFKSIISQETAFFDKHRTGELINRLSADTSLVSHSLTMNISDGLRSSVMIIAGISMMFYVSPKLAIVGLTIVPPVAALAILYGRFVRKITKSLQDTLAEATNVAAEKIGNIRTVKTFSKEKEEIQRYSEKMTDVLKLAKREAWARGIFYGMTGLSGNAIILSVLYNGALMVAESHITVGDLSSFLLYAAYTGISISGLSSFYSEMNKSIGASTRLWELMDRTPKIPVSGGLIPNSEARGDIAFKNVVFSYPSRSEHLILNSMSLNLPAGSVTAVVGPSGSGKSTLAALLLRLYEPQSGEITFDEKSINDYDPSWLRNNIGTVSQEPVLFSGTLRDNIIYGHLHPECVTEEELIAVAEEANALNFIETFPDQFETKVGEKGVLLSGGQKQRIAIARALIRNPKVLILDEATSALDAESEYLVQEAFQRILKGRTVLTIAHRLSTIRNADQIAMLEKGNIVDFGTYNDLINKDGPFKNLIKHQTNFT